MLQRLESVEDYVRNLRKSIEDDRKSYGLVRPLQNGELLPNNNGIPLVKDLNNKENNAHGSDYNNNSNNMNIMDMNNLKLEIYGPGKFSCNRTTVARVYAPVHLKQVTEKDLEKWDLSRNNDLPPPWTYFKLNKEIYKPPDCGLSENGDDWSIDTTTTSNDKNTMKNNGNIKVGNNNNNNNQCTTTTQKTNPWKAREGNVSTMTEFFKVFLYMT